MSVKIKNINLVVAASCLLMVIVSGHATALAGEHFDTLSSGGWQFRWSNRIAIAINDTTRLADTIFVNNSVSCSDPSADSNALAEDKEETGETWSEGYSILSIVGPYLTYCYSYNGSTGTHPTSGAFYRTRRAGTKRDVSLADLFPENDLLQSLLEDTLIQSHLGKLKPRSLSELTKNLYGECEMDFGELLISFAFYDVYLDTAEVEIGLNHGCELMRERFTELLIDLPIPDSLKEAFQYAKKRKKLAWYTE